MNEIFQDKTIYINNSIFLQNKVLKYGGAIYIVNAFVKIYDTLFQENEAEKGGSIYGSSQSNNIIYIYLIKLLYRRFNNDL